MNPFGPFKFVSSIVMSVFVASVGNKNDCPERKVVETHDAQRFAQQMGIQLFETSAKENVNVEEVRSMNTLNVRLNS